MHVAQGCFGISSRSPTPSETVLSYQLHFFYIPPDHKEERYYTDSESHPRHRSEFIPFYVRMYT